MSTTTESIHRTHEARLVDFSGDEEKVHAIVVWNDRGALRGTWTARCETCSWRVSGYASLGAAANAAFDHGILHDDLVPTVRYEQDDDDMLGCTFVVGEGDDDTCDAPAPWVAAEFAPTDGTRAMKSGWGGNAWCDEHRGQKHRGLGGD